MTRRPPTLAARRWLENNLVVDLYSLVNPGVQRLRYEDFARDPEPVANALVRRLGLDLLADPSSGPGHSFSGNPMRFERSPLRVRPDTAWITALDPWERRKVTMMTFALLKKYGYPLTMTGIVKTDLTGEIAS